MPERSADFLGILRALSDHRVEHIVVGGVCAVLHGAPVTTFDLDLVHERSPENIARLKAALDGLGAHYRGRPGPPLAPDPDHLAGPGHHLLTTDAGPLDLLGTIGAGRGFAELAGHTEKMEVSGMGVLVLDLEMLIRVKEERAREKDQLMLTLLRRLHRERGGTA
jgi:hypothetical protein